MICDIRISARTGKTIFLPLYRNTAQDLYDMLDKVFPYTAQTFDLGFWNFTICSYKGKGFDNGVCFHG